MPSYGVELHQRTYTRYYHTVLYEHRTDWFVQPYGAGKNHDRRNVADKHGQHMLKTEWDCFAQWHSTVKLIEILCRICHNYISINRNIAW